MGYEFSDRVKEACWEKSAAIPGRDPARWRFDANGTPVLYDLRGRDGLCGWCYDHVFPKSAASELPLASRHTLKELTNCQVLQTTANKRKGSKKLPSAQVKDLACNITLIDEHLDLIELSVHGDINDEKGRPKCKYISKSEATSLIEGNVSSSHTSTLILGNETRYQVSPHCCPSLTGTRYCDETVNNVKKALKHLHFSGKEAAK